MPNARDYLSTLEERGRYHFTLEDLRSAMGGSSAAAKQALSRLAKRGVVASPARGFYIIVPPEYQSLGSLPADQFIPALMDRSKLPYYVGLLSAAQYHGAAHHRPQKFQVMLPKNRPPIVCGKVRVAFFARKRLAEVPTQPFNTPRGTIAVSTVEATAVDLIGYNQQAGGLDNVATILAELAEKIDAMRLVDAAETAPISWAQRLGHILELVGAQDQAASLKSYVQRAARDMTPLLSGHPHDSTQRAGDWRLWVNAKVEPEV